MSQLKSFARHRVAITLLLLSMSWLFPAQPLVATDYLLTIGGGYSREGNQASLEANVVFFQQVLVEKHHGSRRHVIYFADGNDPAADLQILAEKQAKSASPATDLLAALHRRRSEVHLEYRNHRVADISGALDPKLIRTAVESVAEKARAGDRLIVYVTAHGSAGPRGDEFNTTIDCWNGKKISAREFSTWLDILSPDVPVVMIMAQCYCGGFGHTIFEDLTEEQGLTSHLRVGFFAQQHDRPAAGCRPDIEHDEEFSSYFWGALADRSRNGVPINGCDINGDGVVSFAEAHAYAAIAGDTIDIPLRSSEVLLRTYSRLTPEKMEQAAQAANDTETKSDELATEAEAKQEKSHVFTLDGSLATIAEGGHPISKHIVAKLSEALGFKMQDDVTNVLKGLEESRRFSRTSSRGPRQSSGRRELLKEVAEKWPDLGDEQKWTESPLLKLEMQEQLLAEFKQLPAWKFYDERKQQIGAADSTGDQREIRAIKFRRLVNALEAIVLEKNLAQFATPEVVKKYHQLVALEGSTLNVSQTSK